MTYRLIGPTLTPNFDMDQIFDADHYTVCRETFGETCRSFFLIEPTQEDVNIDPNANTYD